MVMKGPQIDNGKLPEKLLNNDLFLLLPSETPFGNMALKHLKIIKRIDYVNFKLKAIYDQWEKIRLRPTNSSDMIANVSHMLKIQTYNLVYPLTY